MRETRVQSLGWKDSLETEMATHSSILAWEMPWTEELGWWGPEEGGGYSLLGRKESDTRVTEHKCMLGLFKA